MYSNAVCSQGILYKIIFIDFKQKYKGNLSLSGKFKSCYYLHSGLVLLFLYVVSMHIYRFYCRYVNKYLLPVMFCS